jgi:hypothetical protein
MIRVVHPGSRILMLTFSHPGSRGQKGTQSRIRIRNTAYHALLLVFLDLLSFYVLASRHSQFMIPLFCSPKNWREFCVKLLRNLMTIKKIELKP